MAISWSHMRKLLEQDRIQYFATRYRKSHDNEGRVAIRLDEEEIFKSNFYDWDIKRHKSWNRNCSGIIQVMR